MSTTRESLIRVRSELEVPKNQYNAHGGFYYRNCEDILKAAKPLLEKYNLMLGLTDEIVDIEGRFYVKATAYVCGEEDGVQVEAHGYAREADTQKGMNAAQLTGAASSYARKYALCALFLIDDSVDADTDLSTQQTTQTGFIGKCVSCGTAYQFESMEQFNAFAAQAKCCEAPNWVVRK